MKIKPGKNLTPAKYLTVKIIYQQKFFYLRYTHILVLHCMLGVIQSYTCIPYIASSTHTTHVYVQYTQEGEIHVILYVYSACKISINLYTINVESFLLQDLSLYSRKALGIGQKKLLA